MSEDESSRLQFSEPEVTAIRKRAVELQAVRPERSTGGAQGGTLLAQLRQAAGEMGLDPAFVEQAAMEIAAGGPRRRPSFWGGPSRAQEQRLVPGRVTEADWPALHSEVRSITGSVGTTTPIGQSLEWTGGGEAGLYLAVVPEGERTRLQVISSCAAWGFLAYLFGYLFAFMLALGLGAGLHLPAIIATALAGGLFGAATIAARGFFHRLCLNRPMLVERIADRLERRIRERGSESSGDGSEAASLPVP